LETVNDVCAVGILGVLIGSAVLAEIGIVYVPVWLRIALVVVLATANFSFIVRTCRCPSCGQYPGRKPVSGRRERMLLFGWAVCLKCLVALRDD